MAIKMRRRGLIEAPLGRFQLADNRAENLIEWNFALLMERGFLAVCWLFIRPQIIQQPV